MGFARQPAPHVIDAAKGAPVEILITAEDIAFFVRQADPFLIENDCVSASGHYAIASCGEVVCAHCSRVFWR
jgi:hypothetical protein